MPRQVATGESILPHMTANWFNKTLQQNKNSPPQGKRELRNHNEDLATFLPTDKCTTVERFCPVGVVGRTDEYGTRVSRTQFVALEALTPYNWIIAQATMTGNIPTQRCVYSGITWAKVTILDPNHKYVTLDDEQGISLVSSDSGRGQLLQVGAEYSLINIGNFYGATEEPTPEEDVPGSEVISECSGTCKYTSSSGVSWALTENNCSTTSTTTSSTTTSSTSTTTAINQNCNRTTSTSTTTSGIECNCVPPTFCPTEAGQCVITQCSSKDYLGFTCPETTTTTSTTSTTTGDCGSAPEPVGDCNVILGTSGDPCGDGCYCVYKNDTLCIAKLGTCVCDPYPEITPPCGTCTGTVTYICGTENKWIYYGGACSIGPIGCNVIDKSCGHSVPSGTCSTCGEILEVPCDWLVESTSSTTSTTTNLCTGPYKHCYSGCPTTTSTTTTTTDGTCSTKCLIGATEGLEWEIVNRAGCPEETCECYLPNYDPTQSCQVLKVTCAGTTTSTTTTTTSTTSTTTCVFGCPEGTSTCVGSPNSCTWAWNGTAWILTSSDCIEGGLCSQDETCLPPGTTPGDTTNTGCCCGGTTTTTTTTTSTTTTTTAAP